MAIKFRRKDGMLNAIVHATGNTATDVKHMNQAAYWLNEEPAGGRVLIVGNGRILELDQKIDPFIKPTKFFGATADAQINWRSTSDESLTGPLLQFGQTFVATAQPTFPVTTTGRFADRFVAPGASLNNGDWVAMWSEDQVRGVHPHFGVGHGQKPMEMVQVHHWDAANETALVRQYVIDEYRSIANAEACVVPLVSGMEVGNLRFGWTGSNRPSDFISMIRFYACANPIVHPSVHVLRNGPGDIRGSFCTDIHWQPVIDGARKSDKTYGTIVDLVNGGYIQVRGEGTRHPFTTTASRQVQESSWAITAVDSGSNTITLNRSVSGTIRNNDHITFTGTLPDGVEANKEYWADSVAGSSLRLLDAPGGNVVQITNETTGGSMWRLVRYGTPAFIHVDYQFDTGPKFEDDLTPESDIGSGADTHAEGFRIRFTGRNDIVSESTRAHYAGNARARETIFDRMYFRGSLRDGNESNMTASALRIAASGCKVIGCNFDSLWRAIRLMRWNTLSQEVIENVEVIGNVFQNCRQSPVTVEWGADSKIVQNVMLSSGYNRGGSPFDIPRLVDLQTPYGGHEIHSNIMPLGSNPGQASDTRKGTIDPGQLDETMFEAAGNICTGYGLDSAGFHRMVQVSSITGNRIRNDTSHGFTVGQQLWVFNDVGDYPPSLPEARYWVVYADQREVELSMTEGGPPITPGGLGQGNLYLCNPFFHEINDLFNPLQITDSPRMKFQFHFHDSQIEIPLAVFLDHTASGNWTLGYKFRREGTTGGSQYIWGTDTNESYHLFSNAGTLQSKRGGGSAQSMMADAVIEGFDYHVMSHFFGSTSSDNYRINGKPELSPLTMAAGAGGETTLYLGSRNTGVNPFRGVLTDVKVWDGSHLGGQGTLLHHWPINDGGTMIRDIVGGLHGNLKIGNGHWEEVM